MELSVLTGAVIQLKIYNPDNLSLIEYFSTAETDYDTIKKDDRKLVKNHLQYFNKDIGNITQIDDNDVVLRLRDSMARQAEGDDDQLEDEETEEQKFKR